MPEELESMKMMSCQIECVTKRKTSLKKYGNSGTESITEMKNY